jgi:Cu(I)/Ag(I) efflux system membrane fusion protein
MKSRVLILMLAVAVTGIAAWLVIAKPFGRSNATAEMPMQDVGAYRIGLVNSPDPPRPGENQLTVMVKDRDGRAVTDASVDARFTMEAMGSMPRMESRGKLESSKGGVYRARYGLSMAGEWDVVVKVAPKNGEPVRADYRLSTSTRGLAPVSATPVVGATPAATNTVDDATVQVDEARRQSLGIRTTEVVLRDLALTVRAAGRVTWDETRAFDVTLKYSGFVRSLAADFTGRAVRKGEPLMTVYSPDLLAAQQEYIEALGAAKTDPMAHDLADAARRRLQLWDVPTAQIDGIALDGRARDILPVNAPVSGVVVEKKVVEGSPFNAGEPLFRIAPVDPIWVMASVFQVDLPSVKVGSPVTIKNPYLDGGSRRGRVAFIGPMLSSDTRTAEVRIEVPNADAALKPGMFVDVIVESPIGKKLAVPETAVLPTGERKVVFVDLGQGRFAPRDVQLGMRAGDWYEVRGGLKAGDKVVTAGNFMISSEARLRSASEKW